MNDNFEHVYFIPGNHDLYYRDKRDVQSVEWARHLPNVTIVNDWFNSGDVVIAPWLVGDDHKKILKKKKAVFIYENKNNHELLAIPVSVNDYYRQWIENTFNWLRTVRKAWEDRTLPNKNYRANSKICKSCPVQKACADAGAGVIKIAPLEGLSEAV